MAFPGPSEYNSTWWLLWNVIRGHTFQGPSTTHCAPQTHICFSTDSLSLMLWVAFFHTSYPNSLNFLHSPCPSPLLWECFLALLCPQEGSLSFRTEQFPVSTMLEKFRAYVFRQPQYIYPGYRAGLFYKKLYRNKFPPQLYEVVTSVSPVLDVKTEVPNYK